jgi:Na+/citrate or Na+/malate symporter
MSPDAKSQALAAAIILVGAGVVIYFLPSIVLWIGNYSPVLGALVGGALVLCFFLIFWLRARHQRNRKG